MALMYPDIIIDREVKLGEYDTLNGKDVVYYVEGKQRKTNQRWAYLQIERQYDGQSKFRLLPYGWTRIKVSRVKRVSDVSRKGKK